MAGTGGTVARLRRWHRIEPVGPGVDVDRRACMSGDGQLWPCETIRLLDVAEAARAFLFNGDTVEHHESGCATYDAYQHGPCDCGAEALLTALAALDTREAALT